MRRRLPILIGLLVAVLAAGGPATAQTASAPRPVLGLPAAGFDAARLPAGHYVFTTPEAWSRFWGAHSSLPTPEVMFPRWQVVVIALGPRPNPGYQVEALSYDATDGGVVVHVHEWTPAPGSVWAATVTYPIDIAAVPGGPAVAFHCTSGPRPPVQPVARDLPFLLVNSEGLAPQAPEQFTAFTDEADWQQFWTRNGAGPLPVVDFPHGRMVVGVLGLPREEAVTVSQVQRADDRITVTLGPGSPDCPGQLGQRTVLLVVPQVCRVDFRFLRFCRTPPVASPCPTAPAAPGVPPAPPPPSVRLPSPWH